jgi:hypothetical protein
VGLELAMNEYVDIPNPDDMVPGLYTSHISSSAPRNDRFCASKGALSSSDISRSTGSDQA